MKKILFLITTCFVMSISETVGQDLPDDVEAIRAFPSQRLNYLFKTGVLPAIFSNKDDFSMFVDVKYWGEGKPMNPAEGEYWFGMRTIQGYKFQNRQTLSLMFDAYKMHDYGRDGTFELNFALGYGYTAKWFGIHGGVFAGGSSFSAKPDLNRFTRASGPVAVFDDSIRLKGSLDWYMYYKIAGIASVRTFFKRVSTAASLFSDLKNYKSKLDVVGVSLKNYVHLDYYISRDLLLASSNLGAFLKREKEKTFSSNPTYRYDASFIAGYNFKENSLKEYSFNGVLGIKKWDFGLDIHDNIYADGKVGFMVKYNLLPVEALAEAGDSGFKIVGYYNYTPLILEMNSKWAVYFQLRIAAF